jgi:hypothetical protein
MSSSTSMSSEDASESLDESTSMVSSRSFLSVLPILIEIFEPQRSELAQQDDSSNDLQLFQRPYDRSQKKFYLRMLQVNFAK